MGSFPALQTEYLVAEGGLGFAWLLPSLTHIILFANFFPAQSPYYQSLLECHILDFYQKFFVSQD